MDMASQSRLYIKYLGNWAEVNCETVSSINEHYEMKSKQIAGWQADDLNLQGYSISASGLNIWSRPKLSKSMAIKSLGLKLIIILKRNRELFDWQIRTEDRYIEYGKAHISDLTVNFSAGEFSNFDITMQGWGELQSVDNENIIGVLGHDVCDILINNEGESIKVI